jgi:hypothetical protein
MAAALEHLNQTLGLTPTIDPDDILGTFLQAGAEMARHPHLVHNLVHTAAGRHARSAHREGRAQLFVDAVQALVPTGIGPGRLHAAGVAVASLCSSAAWVLLCDDGGLSVYEAKAAIAWVIDAVTATIRQGNGPPIKPNRKDRR